MAADIKIELRKTAHMTSAEVRLKDIARVDSANKGVNDRLQRVFIAESPRIGYVKSVSIQDVRRVINKLPENRSLNIHYSGAKKVNVHSRGEKYKYTDLIKRAEKVLRSELLAENRDIYLNAIEKQTTVNLPYGEIRYEARMNAKNITPKMCVWIDVYRKDSFYQSIPVWFNVEVFEPVYIAKNKIEKREIVSVDDFLIARRNIAEVSGNNIQIGMIETRLLIRKTMQQGEIVRADNVKTVPAVVGGKILRAMVNEGSVSIQVNAIARRDAELGEIVKVKSLQGGGVLKARVIGEQLVEVI